MATQAALLLFIFSLMALGGQNGQQFTTFPAKARDGESLSVVRSRRPVDWPKNSESCRFAVSAALSIEFRSSYENGFQMLGCSDARAYSGFLGPRGNRHRDRERSRRRAVSRRLRSGAEHKHQDHGQRAVR